MEQLYHLGVGCNMPEQSPYPNESKEDYKERVKKLKARTSKMRLAISTFKKPSMTDKTKPGDCATCGENEDWHKEYNPETGEGSVSRNHIFNKKR